MQRSGVPLPAVCEMLSLAYFPVHWLSSRKKFSQCADFPLDNRRRLMLGS